MLSGKTERLEVGQWEDRRIHFLWPANRQSQSTYTAKLEAGYDAQSSVSVTNIVCRVEGDFDRASRWRSLRISRHSNKPLVAVVAL